MYGEPRARLFVGASELTCMETSMYEDVCENVCEDVYKEMCKDRFGDVCKDV